MKFIENNLNPGLITGSILSVASLRFFMAWLPNVEPIMLFTIVTALSLGPISGFMIGAGAMLLSDFFMGRAGPWTIYTSLAFGLVGLAVGLIRAFLKNKNWNALKGRASLFGIAFVMTILWDIVTATFYAINFFVPIYAAFLAQIPFTILHLSNSVFAFLFAPYLLKFYNDAKDVSIITALKKLRIYS